MTGDLTGWDASVMVARGYRGPVRPEARRARLSLAIPRSRRSAADAAGGLALARFGTAALDPTRPPFRVRELTAIAVLVQHSQPLDPAIIALVPRAAAGDEAAFTRLVAAFHADMSRVAYVISGGDAELTQDAVQSAWAIAWSRLHTLREPERIRAWLVSVAANEARQGLRHQRRVVAVGLEEADVALHATPSARALDLAAVLARLRPEERALIGLRYVAGLDSREIGAALGMSASGVRSRLDRLLDRLRAELGDE